MKSLRHLGDLEPGVGDSVPDDRHDLGGELPLLLPGHIHIVSMSAACHAVGGHLSPAHAGES